MKAPLQTAPPRSYRLQHFNRLTSQQLAIAAGSALLMAGVLLAQGTRLGYLPLGLAILCAMGVYVRSGRN